MSFIKCTLLFLCLLALNACSLYKSEDRKDFESAREGFRMQNLQATDCAYGTYRSQARAARLVSVLNPGRAGDAVFLWEYRLHDGRSVFETDNLKGIYCRYENSR